MKSRDYSVVIAAVFMSYLIVAEFVFSVRHPWATDAERLVYFREVLTFQSVDYETMRPRNR